VTSRSIARERKKGRKKRLQSLGGKCLGEVGGWGSSVGISIVPVHRRGCRGGETFKRGLEEGKQEHRTRGREECEGFRMLGGGKK